MNTNVTGKCSFKMLLAVRHKLIYGRGDVDELGANIIPQSLQLLLKNEKR